MNLVEFKLRVQVKHPSLQSVTVKEIPAMFAIEKIGGFLDLTDTPLNAVQMVTDTGVYDLVGTYEEALTWYNENVANLLDYNAESSNT